MKEIKDKTYAIVDMDQGLIRVIYPNTWTYNKFLDILEIDFLQEQLNHLSIKFPNLIVREIEIFDI